MNKTKCDKCKLEFSNRGGNFKRHYLACEGPKYVSLEKCKFCNIMFNDFTIREKSTHNRWCSLNPDSVIRRENLKIARERITEESRINAGKKIKLAHINGTYDHIEYGLSFLGKRHSEDSKNRMRERALASKHRRLKKNTIKYKNVLLDSSWELALAKQLDRKGITWIRPDPIAWIDSNNIQHNYFSDFYLPDYDIYLDPKNPHAVKIQKEKIEILLSQYSNIKILFTLEECITFEVPDY